MHRLDKLFCIQRSEIPPSLWTSYMNSSYKCPRRRRKTAPCRSSAGMEQTNNTNPRHGKDPWKTQNTTGVSREEGEIHTRRKTLCRSSSSDATNNTNPRHGEGSLKKTKRFLLCLLLLVLVLVLLLESSPPPWITRFYDSSSSASFLVCFSNSEALQRQEQQQQVWEACFCGLVVVVAVVAKRKISGRRREKARRRRNNAEQQMVVLFLSSVGKFLADEPAREQSMEMVKECNNSGRNGEMLRQQQ